MMDAIPPMVERVARLICATHLGIPPGKADNIGHWCWEGWAWGGDCSCLWSKQAAPAWRTFRPEAEAAIAAMRDADPDVIDAGRDVGINRPYGLAETREKWETMIDACLVNPPPGDEE